MNLLRLTQTAAGGDRYQVQVELTGDGIARQTATSEFAFALTEQSSRR